MDEKSILLMSEELRAALGERVIRIEEATAATTPDASDHVIAASGRILRISSLRNGQVRIRVRTNAKQLAERLLTSNSVITLEVQDRAASFRMQCIVKAVKVKMAQPAVITIYVDHVT